MGRAPCCDKANVKKGPWSPEEDAKLKAYFEQHGTGGNWIALPQKIGLKRCGKSCRLRWLNYLQPNLNHGGFSEEEDNIIFSLYISIGSRWSIIAAQLPGRTDNDIKNYWNTRLKKKLLGKQRTEQAAAKRSARSCIKPEMKITQSESLMVPGLMNQTTPYWPDLPVIMPFINQQQLEPNFKDQESLKNLLIKLGGRSVADYHDQQSNTAITTTTPNVQYYPFDVSFSQDHLYENSISMLASSTSMNSMNSTACRLQDTQYNINGAGQNMFQGIGNNFPAEQSDLIYNNHQRLEIDGLESLHGMEMVNGSTGTSTAESTSWEDISSLVYHPTVVSDYEICQQSIPQDSTFEQPSYFGHQYQCNSAS